MTPRRCSRTSPTAQPAPSYAQYLAAIALSGHDPITQLRTAINARELDTADDAAAVLDWHLDPTGATPPDTDHSPGPPESLTAWTPNTTSPNSPRAPASSPTLADGQ
ncbi:hypothetical protein F3087_26785 [Nocardia colli]|uniref:Uncharacterized protein n=1 Tax=Nocardia colli TaxID=2545717 RepID=A0A5N0E9T7_9NOCA|nr:hypothetical protein [Nocardia colli]KAA8886198.1 hypothetical protein F3087_26785 [Nocardia colli]